MYRKDDTQLLHRRRPRRPVGRAAGEPAQHPRQAVHRLLLRLPPQPVAGVRGLELRRVPLPGRRAADEGPLHRRLRRPRDLPARASRRVLLQGLRADRRGIRAPAKAHPDKLTYNHNFDPRNGEAGWSSCGWTPRSSSSRASSSTPPSGTATSRGWKLDDPWAYRYFEVCRELGIRNIHVHKGPTIRPLDRDAFDVADVDHVRDGLHRPELHRRALRAAAAGGLLLDRHPGAQRVRRARGGDAVHPHPAAVLRADHRRVAVLDRRGPHPVLVGLRDLDADAG